MRQQGLRPFKSIQQRLFDQAARLRERAGALTSGGKRSRLIGEADQLDRAAKLQGWLSSAGLRPPK